jgi:hypothetical protein
MRILSRHAHARLGRADRPGPDRYTHRPPATPPRQYHARPPAAAAVPARRTRLADTAAPWVQPRCIRPAPVRRRQRQPPRLPPGHHRNPGGARPRPHTGRDRDASRGPSHENARTHRPGTGRQMPQRVTGPQPPEAHRTAVRGGPCGPTLSVEVRQSRMFGARMSRWAGLPAATRRLAGVSAMHQNGQAARCRGHGRADHTQAGPRQQGSPADGRRRGRPAAGPRTIWPLHGDAVGWDSTRCPIVGAPVCGGQAGAAGERPSPMP